MSQDLCYLDKLTLKKNNFIKYTKIIDQIMNKYNFKHSEFIQACISSVLENVNEEYDSIDFDILTEMVYIKLEL